MQFFSILYLTQGLHFIYAIVVLEMLVQSYYVFLGIYSYHFLHADLNVFLFIFTSVALMRSKLDPEGLGIITRTAFLEEFFPEDPAAKPPMAFNIYHYNGLYRPSQVHKVVSRLLYYTVNSRCNAFFGVHKIQTAVLRMRGIKIRPVS